MKKIEIIWRELLFQAIEKKNPPAGEADRQFTQKDLSLKFNFSTSTIFQALKIPRKMGAVRVTGRFFVLEDPEKLLYHWASVRNIQKDVVFTGYVASPIFEIEGNMPSDVIFAGFSAARRILGVSPADYDKVFVYTKNIDFIKKRFDFRKGRENLIVLRQDPFLAKYGSLTTLSQTFVDLWNLPSWQAKEYVNVLKEKIDGLLP